MENQGRLSSVGQRRGRGWSLTEAGKNEGKKGRGKSMNEEEGEGFGSVGVIAERRTREIGTNFVASFCKAKGTYRSEYINEAARFDTHRPRRVIFNY